jgi:hypothetical protein
MPLAWFAALAFFAAMIPPVRIGLTIRVHEAPGATADDAARVSAALERGFYADSVVVPPAETLHFDRPPIQMPDSAARERIGHRVIVRGSVGAIGPVLEVRLRLLNILAQPMGSEDTVRLQRSEIDSAFAAKGRAYAVSLSQRFKR